MVFKKIALMSVLSAFSLPIIANAASIDLINNTDYYGTAKVSIFCSNMAGNNGVIKPHDKINISQDALNFACPGTCDAQVYVTKDCSGKAIAKAKLDNKKGILDIHNLDEQRFHISGGGTSATIDPVASTFMNWLEKIF